MGLELRNSKTNPKADYYGVRSKVGTTVAEYGVILVEVVLITCFAVPTNVAVALVIVAIRNAVPMSIARDMFLPFLDH